MPVPVPIRPQAGGSGQATSNTLTPFFWAGTDQLAVWDIAYTTDDASDATPSWTNVAVGNIRSVAVSRGRENELGRVEAGTAQIVLNNRTRLFDSTVVTGLGPMNRWRIRAVFNGVTYPIFLGYAESYDQQWPGNGRDAITVVDLVDEFKILALDALPVMDPPTATTYADVMAYDTPHTYWQLQGQNEVQIFAPKTGSTLLAAGTMGRAVSAIIGDSAVDVVGGTYYGARSTTAFFYSIAEQDAATPGMEVGGAGDATGLSTFTYEQWFKSSEATPAANRIIAEGPYDAGSNVTWAIVLTTTGKIQGTVRNTTPTSVTATGATSISANTWYHIAMTYDGTNIRVYLNGVQDGIAAQTGLVQPADATGPNHYLSLGRGTPGGTRYYDEVAWYQYTVSADRLLAHYTAGALRGWGIQEPKDRMASVVADSTSIAATNFDSTTGRRQIPAFQHGQAPLEELRRAEEAENGGVLFVASDGTITSLQENWYGIPPYNTVQATFDDDGTDLPYIECSVDYSETFLFNEVIVAREGGDTYTASDATSIARYMKRTLSYPALPIADDGDLVSLGDNRLAEHKDPRTRITSLTVSLKTAAVITAVLPLDLFDLIRILRTQPGGGARLDQQLQIQKINLDARPERPWTMRFSLGPY